MNRVVVSGKPLDGPSSLLWCTINNILHDGGSFLRSENAMQSVDSGQMVLLGTSTTMPTPSLERTENFGGH